MLEAVRRIFVPKPPTLEDRLATARAEAVTATADLAKAEADVANHDINRCERGLALRIDLADDAVALAEARGRLAGHVELHADLHRTVAEAREKLSAARASCDEISNEIAFRAEEVEITRLGDTLDAEIDAILAAAISFGERLARANLAATKYREGRRRHRHVVSGEAPLERLRNLERETTSRLLAGRYVRVPALGLKGIAIFANLPLSEVPVAPPGEGAVAQPQPTNVTTSFGLQPLLPQRQAS